MNRDPVAAVLLAVAAALVFVAPEHIAWAMRWWQPGVEYIATGCALCLLSLAVGWMASQWLGWRRFALVSVWPAYEGALMAASRLAFPLDAPVKLPPGRNMADVAFGPWATWISLGLGFWGAAYVLAGLRDGSRSDRR